MPLWAIILIVAGSVLLLGGLIFFVIYSDVQMVKATINPKFKERQKMLEDLNDLEKEGLALIEPVDFELTLRDGYLLHGDYSLNKNKSNKFVIILHGHGSTREGTLKYIPLYYNLGYNIIRYDHRGHGDNERTICTMGIRESEDLNEVITWAKEKFGEDIYLALHGTSLGGATALLVTKYRQDIKYIVADCPYSSMIKFAGDYVHNLHLPYWPFKIFFPMVLHKMSGFDMLEMAPIKYIQNNKVPTLHVHGMKDKFIRPYHCKLLFNKNGAEDKEMHYFPNGTHGRSVLLDHDEYKKVLSDFISRQESK